MLCAGAIPPLFCVYARARACTGMCVCARACVCDKTITLLMQVDEECEFTA